MRTHHRRRLRHLALPLVALLLVACGDDDSNADTVPNPPAVHVDVTIGIDSGPDRVETVAVGSLVTLTVTSPDVDDEIHVHGIDLEQEVAAGASATFTFTVDRTGTIEVESHFTDEVVIVIEVV